MISNDPFANDPRWADAPSRIDLVVKLIKSFIMWVTYVVLPSLVIAVGVWILVFFTAAWRFSGTEEEFLFWSNVWGGVAFIGAAIFFSKNNSRRD